MNQIASESKINVALNACYHCGEPCSHHDIVLEEKIFCCEGCKTVYSILQQNDLCQYYQLNEGAGISQKNIPLQAYAFLDAPDTIQKLIDFTDGNRTKIRFHLPQIHCSSCLWLLENLHQLSNGISQSTVDFLQKEVRIVFNNAEISLRQVVELLAQIGYPPLIRLHHLDNEQKKTDKSLYYKLGLAGFVFGNIMLFSFPEYLGLNAEYDGFFSQIFAYLNVILILPVLLYSSQDYFRSAWQGLKRRHLNIDVPVSLGILALFFRSIFEIATHTGAGYLDSLAGLIFFLLIGKWFQQTTYAKIAFDRDYKSYFTIAFHVKKSDGEHQITLDKLKIGDHIVIRHGELIPADAILKKGEALVDYSFVSGESDLVRQQIGDQLYAGGRQMGGLIELLVSKEVSNSYLTQLWNEDTFHKSTQEGQVSALANQVARIFTWVILAIAFATLAYWLPKNSTIAINAFTAVLIIACPCAVALSMPFTFGNVIRILAKKGIYLKNIQIVEALANIEHIVFDKTGTLTDTQNSTLIFEGKNQLTNSEEQFIRSLANYSNHPLSRQIVQKYAHHTPLKVIDFQEFKGKGIIGVVEGQVIQIGSNIFLQVQQQEPTTTTNNASVWIKINGILKGTFTISTAYRKHLQAILTQLQNQYKLSLLSGDNDKEKPHLQPWFGTQAPLLFNQKPKDKLQYIQKLQAQNTPVAMIGDGLNDAGALAQSNVGIVITENTSNFTPACDIIMDAQQFEHTTTLLKFAKRSIQLVWIAYGIAIVYNIIGLSYAVQGMLSPVIAAILMPLSSVSIVLFGVTSSYYVAKQLKLV